MDDKKKIAVFDIDGTFYRWSLLIDLVEYLMKLQRILPSHFVESEALRKQWEERETGYTNYINTLVIEWEQRALGGLAEVEVVNAAREVLARKRNRVYMFTRELLGSLKACGYACAAISGSPKQIVEVFGQAWGFDYVLGTELVLDRRGIFSRDQSKAVKHTMDKGLAYEAVVKKLDVDTDGSIAIGDSSSDLSMLNKVEFPIAFNPEATLLKSARQTGLAVVLERKNVITALRTLPNMTNMEMTAFLFREVLWSDILPIDVAEELKKRLAKLDQVMV